MRAIIPFWRAMAVLAVLAACGGLDARGALLVYEGFETTAANGTTLQTFGGSGFGWGGNWVAVSPSTGLTVGTVGSPGTGLQFGDLPVEGKLAASASSRQQRVFAESYTLGTGSGQKPELWISYLTTWSGLDSTVSWFKITNGGVKVIDAGVNNWQGGTTPVNTDIWMMPSFAATGETATNAVQMATFRLRPTGTSDTLVDFYLGSGGDLSLGAVIASYTVAGQRTIDGIELQSDRVGGSTWDEIRVGESYVDVVVVPEPGPLVLLMGAGFWFHLARRRRRGLPEGGLPGASEALGRGRPTHGPR